MSVEEFVLVEAVVFGAIGAILLLLLWLVRR
jgi:hypothetical protein